MAKRKVKRKAPKRKRKVAKRKRKAPKRRRKRKFGNFLEKAKAKALELAKKAKEAVGGAKTMFIDLGGKQILLLLVPFIDFKTIIEKLKNDSQKKIANDIEGKIKADLEAGDLDLKGTISYFKETVKGQGEEAKKKAEELNETFYTMIQEKQIYKKLEEQVNKAFEKIPNKTMIEAGLKQLKLGVELNYTGFLSILNKVYTDSKDVSKKLSFNILGSLLSKTPTESDYKKNLITDIKAAGTAAIDAAKKEIDKKVSGEEKPKEEPKKEESKTTEVKTKFGKRKKGPSASLKKLCKKNGVRLMVKRGKKRVYKSSKVLKEQCQRKLKKNKKKNFGRKKIKRSSIMPPKRRTPKRRKVTKRGGKKSKKRRGKKSPKTFKKLMEEMYKGAQKRGRAASRYVRKNPKKIARGVAGAAGLGYAGYEGYLGARRGLDVTNSRFIGLPEGAEDPYASPTRRAYRGAKGYAGRAYDAAKGANYRSWPRRGWDATKAAPGAAWSGAKGYAGRAKTKASSGMDYLRSLFKRGKEKTDEEKEFEDVEFGKRKRRRRRKTAYGKRKRRRRSFGKKAKKPSAALRRLCKKLKVRTTLKRGGKRVYKSEAMLKKQCKKAMKRKKKKSKK